MTKVMSIMDSTLLIKVVSIDKLQVVSLSVQDRQNLVNQGRV